MTAGIRGAGTGIGINDEIAASRTGSPLPREQEGGTTAKVTFFVASFFVALGASLALQSPIPLVAYGVVVLVCGLVWALDLTSDSNERRGGSPPLRSVPLVGAGHGRGGLGRRPPPAPDPVVVVVHSPALQQPLVGAAGPAVSVGGFGSVGRHLGPFSPPRSHTPPPGSAPPSITVAERIQARDLGVPPHTVAAAVAASVLSPPSPPRRGGLSVSSPPFIPPFLSPPPAQQPTVAAVIEARDSGRGLPVPAPSVVAPPPRASFAAAASGGFGRGRSLGPPGRVGVPSQPRPLGILPMGQPPVTPPSRGRGELFVSPPTTGGVANSTGRTPPAAPPSAEGPPVGGVIGVRDARGGKPQTDVGEGARRRLQKRE